MYKNVSVELLDAGLFWEGEAVSHERTLCLRLLFLLLALLAHLLLMLPDFSH